jgi:uncharacterized peroxidase-related enzyme
MSRVNVVDRNSASGEARELLDAVQAQLGATPAFIRVLANSPAALRGFLGLYAGVGAGSLGTQTAERIALAVAQENACEYCVSAHTAIGRKAGLSLEEVLAARAGHSSDAKAAAAVAFAKSLVENAGAVSAAEVEALRAAGYDDAGIVDIIVAVSLNVLTNFLGKATRVEIDFPRVELGRAA